MLNTNNFELLPHFMPSMFIPKVFINITQRTILKTVKKLNLGTIESVVMIKHTSRTGELYHSVIINIIWNKDSSSLNVRNKLLNGCEVTIMYDNPWFWKVVAYKIASIKQITQFENNRKPPPVKSNINHGRDTIEINENTDEFGRDLTRYVKKPILKRGDDLCTFKSIMKRLETHNPPIIWADVYSSDEEDADADADTDAELNMICDLMPQLYIRPHSPDYPPPNYVRPVTPDFPPPTHERQTRPNRFLDIDNLNEDTNRFIIDYSGALPVPQKIKRKIVKK
jgi:hypothetical protein